MDLRILDISLLKEFKSVVKESPFEKVDRIAKPDTPIDYFEFYKSVSSVYSSKIEGVEIDFDSYFKHKFLNVKFNPDYTQKADDLYSAYEIIDKHELTLENVRKAHSILSSSLLPKSQQGLVRTNPMFVLNNDDEIEFVAAGPEIVKQELNKLFHDITFLRNAELDPFETFYFAAFIHLVFVKIHPFQDGNGRLSRILTNLLMLQAGYVYMPYASHEKIIEDNKPEYYLALRQSQKTFTTNHETIAPWLAFFLDVTLHQSRIALDLFSEENIEKLLSPRQLEIWQYMQDAIEVTPRELSEKLAIPRPTINQVLDRLLELNKIERLGLGRGTRYRVKQ